MKIASNIAGVILGLLFLLASGGFFYMVISKTPLPANFAPGSPADLFMKAVFPTGFMLFVKCFELIGAVLVMIPKTRNFGLLVLGPIIINILAFHLFLDNPKALLDPMIILIVALAAFLLWSGRKAFAGLRG
jgi:hypothetical protein